MSNKLAASMRVAFLHKHFQPEKASATCYEACVHVSTTVLNLEEHKKYGLPGLLAFMLLDLVKKKDRKTNLGSELLTSIKEKETYWPKEP